MYVRSNGKLMLSGEYLVLAGARALATPVRYGQSLETAPRKDNTVVIYWKSFVKGAAWLDIIFMGDKLMVSTEQLNPTGRQSVAFIREALLAAKRLKPGFLKDNRSWDVCARIEFDREWGLGSSSSLLSNIACWADINPYDLFFAVSEGSGYDIACARSQSALIYTYKGHGKKPAVKNVRFEPPFHDHLYFIYSGRKQDSAKSLSAFDPQKVKEEDVHAISLLTDHMVKTADLNSFIGILKEHEAITAAATGMQPVQKKYFTDFRGVVKSLGAWGGDFLLAASDMPAHKIRNYFVEKQADIIIPFREMMPAKQT